MKDNSPFENKRPEVTRSRCVKVFDVSHSCSDAVRNTLPTVLI